MGAELATRTGDSESQMRLNQVIITFAMVTPTRTLAAARSSGRQPNL
jgi:hypothetical protein